MNENPIQGLMSTTMSSIKDMIDVNTIIGDQITTADGTVIIPISKVSFGFASGGSEFANKNTTAEKMPFGGGAGAGVTINPIAFLVVSNGNVKLIQITENNNTLDKLVTMIPEVMDKTKDFFTKE